MQRFDILETAAGIGTEALHRFQADEAEHAGRSGVVEKQYGAPKGEEMLDALLSSVETEKAAY